MDSPPIPPNHGWLCPVPHSSIWLGTDLPHLGLQRRGARAAPPHACHLPVWAADKQPAAPNGLLGDMASAQQAPSTPCKAWERLPGLEAIWSQDAARKAPRRLRLRKAPSVGQLAEDQRLLDPQQPSLEPALAGEGKPQDTPHAGWGGGLQTPGATAPSKAARGQGVPLLVFPPHIILSFHETWGGGGNS